jgi:hypothetical protein
VVLSATLPAGRRRELVEAYARSSAEAARSATEFEAVSKAGAYPLLTAVTPGGAPVLRNPGASARGTDVTLERIDDDLDVLVDRLATELDGGGCTLVVRNTVKRVLETAQVLRTRFGDEHVTVAHSCFIDIDRAAKDTVMALRAITMASMGTFDQSVCSEVATAIMLRRVPATTARITVPVKSRFGGGVAACIRASVICPAFSTTPSQNASSRLSASPMARPPACDQGWILRPTSALDDLLPVLPFRTSVLAAR